MTLSLQSSLRPCLSGSAQQCDFDSTSMHRRTPPSRRTAIPGQHFILPDRAAQLPSSGRQFDKLGSLCASTCDCFFVTFSVCVCLSICMSMSACRSVSVCVCPSIAVCLGAGVATNLVAVHPVKVHLLKYYFFFVILFVASKSLLILSHNFDNFFS